MTPLQYKSWSINWFRLSCCMPHVTLERVINNKRVHCCCQEVQTCRHFYYNYEKYPLSPLRPRFLVLIEQYLPNISDTVYSVHQSFMWFLWLNCRKSTFYPVTAPNDSTCWHIVTSTIQEPAASNCDVTMTDCSRVVAMDSFLAQWNRKFITAELVVDREHFLNKFLCLSFF